MAEIEDDDRRTEARARIRRDFDRYQRRDPHGGFRRALALVGSVGWPIVLLATGGAWLGRTLDQRFGTGVRLTLGLVTVATALGSYIAYRSVREESR